MLFGTSGIRDFYGTKITPEFAMTIANVFAQRGENIAIATDMRETSELLKNAVISGVLAKGANAIELGEIPTPTLAYYTKQKNGKGIMITASHNPSEYNGLKIYRNGREVSKNEEKQIEKKFTKGMKLCEWDEAGELLQYPNAIHDHINMILKTVNKTKIKNTKIKVVVDTNGVGTVIAQKLFSELGCNVIEINKVKRGFARQSEPNDKNLSDLKKKVIETNAHLGIGMDGDGDRAIIVDEKGKLLGLDVQLAIAIEHELSHKKGIVKSGAAEGTKGTIISTVECSVLIKETINKNNGKNIIVSVGSTNISDAMEKNCESIFGGEPAGEYIFKNGVNTPDGILVAAKFLEIFAEKGKLSELKKNYKIYPILREKFKCANKKKAMEKILKTLSLGGIRNMIDGIREDFEDGFVLVRQSGTENAIRLTAEFKDRKRLDEMIKKVRKIIARVL
ncbi:MAG: hypothetical protein AB1391_01850 [Candidatus Micrarchaeota archaeon]